MNILDIFMTLLILPLNPFRERKISKSCSGNGSGYSDPPEQVEAIGHEIYSGSSPNWVATGQTTTMVLDDCRMRRRLAIG
jgi:hypothetical protein